MRGKVQPPPSRFTTYAGMPSSPTPQPVPSTIASSCVAGAPLASDLIVRGIRPSRLAARFKAASGSAVGSGGSESDPGAG